MKRVKFPITTASDGFGYNFLDFLPTRFDGVWIQTFVFSKYLPEAEILVWFNLLHYVPANSYGHVGTVISPNHTSSWASLNS